MDVELWNAAFDSFEAPTKSEELKSTQLLI